MLYKDNQDPQSKSRAVDKNVAALHNLLKELKSNLAKSQELQILYYNKYVKKRTYRPEESIWLRRKHIKTKRNPKLEHKYLGPLEIVEADRNQAYKLKLLVKQHINIIFYVLSMKRDVTTREAVDQKIADQLQFEEEK